MQKTTLKTPISYYGGKQTMARLIVSLIPPHRLYCEPFAGGLAVFWAKPPSTMEVINDTNEAVVTFYQVLKSDYAILRHLVLQTPVSRKVHRQTDFVLKYPDHFDKIKVALAFWVQTNVSFGAMIGAGYGYARTKNTQISKINNKKLQFGKHLSKRLENVDMECNDAIQVIKSRDCEDAFFYIDPPYFNADMGHYAGYTKKDFTALLDYLSQIKGKFLLSSYPSDVLTEYVQKNNWQVYEKSSKIAVTHLTNRIKTECLTANYDILSLI
jgi:site-specific DNA-adenine methylase